jgi:hypothetical protein
MEDGRGTGATVRTIAGNQNGFILARQYCG